MRRKYVFEVIIWEGSDEFWDSLDKNDTTGCDEVLKKLRDLLDASPFDVLTRLVEYKHTYDD